MLPDEPRVALVHDFLLDLRGGERVFLALCEMFPEADLFTAVYDPVGTEGRFAHRRVHTSFLQRLRPDATSFRRYLPLYPYAMEALDLSGYDLVLSSSSAWAHGVLPSENAVHVCYCHNPFRYAWNAREATLRGRGPIARAALGAVLSRWRQWDWIAAQRVDRYVANSETTRRRIARYFTREADVVHPPVEIERFAPGVPGEHYVVLSELMPHKRIELAVRAFGQLRRPLVIIGDGPDARRLQRLAGPTVRFTGRVSDAEVARLLATSRALVVTATEEFGIAAVEAQAAGRPVIALDEGGVTESVVEGRTGVFYESATPEALAEAVAAFDPLSVDPADCVANAQRFSADAFRAGILANVEQGLAAGPGPRGERRRPALGLALAGRRTAA
ncbi:glycosyltransferase family 4 protein [Baekduia soli]|uniref:Glycosyltransferase family 4 protein n=1 Tax=Baekduia soli TaxID=496014 RepID=A0A5B8U9B8_9ACTN|nr:glycosyltransferase [Baekduia soli]QEC49577.1 glycosyltransferase family 4 protein [Baekduia soli]